MKRTSGQHAFMAAVGAGFAPDDPNRPVGGVELEDGEYGTSMHHSDGRALHLLTLDGDGWQLGDLLAAVAGGSWNLPGWHGNGDGTWQVTTWEAVRAMLRAHESDRERPYDLSEPTYQQRPLDGRERDILTRILRDIVRACTNPEAQRALLGVIRLEGPEANRLQEIAAVLDPRHD